MACATKFAFGYLTPCSLLPNRSGFPCPNCKMKACKEMEGGIDRATCNIGWMGESALEFLPFKSNLGRTSMDGQICLKRKIIYRPSGEWRGGWRGMSVEADRDGGADAESIRRREGEQRDRRQQFFLPANPIFCIVTVVAAMIGRGRCRECDGFITYAL